MLPGNGALRTTGSQLAGSPRPARTRAAWLAALAGHPALDQLRADRRRNILLAARILGWSADPSMSTRPTRAATAARMGVSERTVSKLWRVLEQAGWLQCTEPGTTAAYRPSWARGDGNLARTWQLTIPASVPQRGESSPRPGSLINMVSNTPATRFPQTKKLSEKGWAAEARRFLAAGWLYRDVEHARNYSPAGRPWRFDDPPRFPRALMRFRLSRWLGAGGAPLAPPSQARAAARVADLEAQAARRRELAAAAERAGGVDVHAQAARARAMLVDALSRPHSHAGNPVPGHS